MKIVKCVNGHFFDCETYQSCPHCGSTELSSNHDGFNKEKKSGKIKEFLISKKRHDNEKTEIPDDVIFAPPEINSSKSFQVHLNDGSVKKDLPENPCDEKAEKTLDFWQDSKPEPIEDKEPPEDVTETKNKVSLEEEFVNLRSVVENASASDEEKTVSYFSAANEKMDEENQKNITNSVDPVVGWLVCVFGNHFGESFCINAGKNSIGRSGDNKIVLTKDKKVSRSKHAFIIYEPKKKDFYLEPGDSSGLTYLNDEYITDSKKLKAKDILEIGGSKFMFLPLCGSDFSWEDYLR